jgi:hypothetical protein
MAVPGNDPSRPASHAHLCTGLSRHGITTHAGRNTAVGALAAELPAPILAGITGLNINTATSWTRTTNRDWTDYLAARTPHQNEMAGDEGLLQYASSATITRQHPSGPQLVEHGFTSTGVVYGAAERFARGHGISQIAHDLRVTEGLVERWHRAWRDGGAGTLRCRC